MRKHQIESLSLLHTTWTILKILKWLFISLSHNLKKYWKNVRQESQLEKVLKKIKLTLSLFHTTWKRNEKCQVDSLYIFHTNWTGLKTLQADSLYCPSEWSRAYPIARTERHEARVAARAERTGWIGVDGTWRCPSEWSAPSRGLSAARHAWQHGPRGLAGSVCTELGAASSEWSTPSYPIARTERREMVHSWYFSR